jgi:hypothetical protein
VLDDRHGVWLDEDQDHNDVKQGAHGGHHHHHGRSPSGPKALRVGLTVLITAAVLTLTAMVWLWPRGEAKAQPSMPGVQHFDGVVLSIKPVPCPPLPSGFQPPPGFPTDQQCGTVTVRMSDGPDKGKEILTDIPAGPGAPTLHADDAVVLIYTPDAVSGQPYQIVDHQRSAQLWALALAFAWAVIAFGRWRGVTALAGLAVTFAILLLFIVPAILAGQPPLLVAIVGSAAIMLSVLYLTHGFNTTTTVAVLGTLTSLVLTGLLATVATSAAKLSGISSEQASFLSLSSNVNMQGLLLAAILIGSLGVLDDVAVTQASTVTELANANPELSARQLYRSASRIGRAHIASVMSSTRSSWPTPERRCRYCYCSPPATCPLANCSPANSSPRKSCAVQWAPSA